MHFLQCHKLQLLPLNGRSLDCSLSNVNNEKFFQQQQQQTSTLTSTVTWYITERARGPSRTFSTYLMSFYIIQSNHVLW